MTAHDRLESELTAWFVETATPMNDDDIDLILRRTAGTRQRPRWTFLERWLPMQADTLAVPSRSPSMRNLAILAALLIIAAAIVVVGVASQPTRLAYESIASNGLVAYAIDGDIVAIDPTTGDARTLVGGPETDRSPTFSADGSQIAFAREGRSGEQTLFVIPASGGTPVPITAEPMDIIGPTWSPDGTAVAFTNGDLVVAATDGSGARILPIAIRAQFARFRPPDGAQIMVTDASDNLSMYLVGVESGDLARIAYPDGRGVRDQALGWTPDGTQLVIVRPVTPSDASGRAEAHLLTVAADGTVTGDEAFGPPLAPGSFGMGVSPEGARVAVPAAEGDDRGGWRTAIVPLDPAEKPILTGPVFRHTDVQLEWSPDGTMVVARDHAAGETWLLDAAGDGPGRQAPWHDPSGELLDWQRLAP